MARINTEQLRNWQNGDIIPASDYNQERNLIITAQNDTNDKANKATQDANNAVNRLSELSIQPTEVDKTSVVQSFTQTLTQGQTSVTLPSEYLPNTNRLQVFIDGKLVQVTETSNTGFTLRTPASEGQLLAAYWFTELPRVLDIERIEEAIENSRTEFLSPVKTLGELPNPTTDGWHIFVQEDQKVYRRQYGQWVAIYSVPQYVGDTLVSRAYHKETPTTQKSVFTLPNHYLPDNNRIDVYLSGVKQRSGVDYTETTTNKVTFQTPVEAGTNVEFVYFSQPQALAEDYFAQAKLAEQATIAAQAAAQVANESALNRKEPVSTYSALLATPAVKADARMVRDTGKVYRYDGSQWKLIEEIDATVINEVDSRLTSQLADKATVVSVEKFGASPSNPDNYDAFAATIAYAKINRCAVSVPDGTFIISSPDKLLIDYDVFTLRGTGKYSSVIKFTHADGGFLFKKTDPTAWMYKPFFESVMIQGENICNTLVKFENPISEMNVNNSYFGESVQNAFVFTELNGVWFNNADIVNSENGVSGDIFGIVNFSFCNIFNLTNALKVEQQIQFLSLRSTYLEACDRTIYGTSTFIGIGQLSLDDVNILHNTGTSAPFLFEKLDYATKFLIDKSLINIQTNAGSVVRVNTPRTGNLAFITIDKTLIQQRVVGQLSDLVFVPVSSTAATTRVLLQHVTYPSVIPANSLISGNRGSSNVISSLFNYTASNGIQLTQNDFYAGRVFYDTDNSGLFVTNANDTPQRIMLVRSGTTAERPANYPVGQSFYDLSLYKPVYWTGFDWRDSTGTTV